MPIDEASTTGNITIFGTNGNVLLEYELKKFEEMKKLINKVEISKILTFCISKLNSDLISQFTTDEYLEFKGIANTKNNRKKYSKKLEQNLSVLLEISKIRFKSKIGPKFLGECYLIPKFICRNGYFEIYYDPEFLANLENYYGYFPRGLGKISDKKYPHAWTIGVFLCVDYLRQNPNKYKETKEGWIKVYLKNTTILKKLTLPSVETVKRNGRQYDQRIISILEETYDALTQNLIDYDIQFEGIRYQEIKEFENGYTTVTFKNEKIIRQYREIAKNSKNNRIQTNKKKQIEYVKETIKLNKKGKTNKEIAKILGKTVRTIRNYQEIITKRERKK